MQAAIDAWAGQDQQGTSMRTIAEAVGPPGRVYRTSQQGRHPVAVADRYLEHVVARLQPRDGVGATSAARGYLTTSRPPSTTPAPCRRGGR